MQRWNSESRARPTDIVSWLLKAIDDDDASAPPGTQALHEDGRLMVIAGRYDLDIIALGSSRK